MTAEKLENPSQKTAQATEPEKKKKDEKLNWYWAPTYCALWFLLFSIIVIPSYYHYPKTLRIHDEFTHPDAFIGERAEDQLFKLTNIGVRVTDSIENEILAVRFLVEEIENIKAAARLDLYDIEAEVQHATGDFTLSTVAVSYQNVSNVVVKLAPKNMTRTASLLVNAHFDSVVTSPGAGDDGVMIVIMLETMRVISKSEKPLLHPIVFLFNGAEETGLLASHGFITQHRWAPDCKAFINLDSAGSGGREILFQTGPQHPWLVNYYKASVPHPFGNTIAEELFQNNFIPSDTDYRIFRDFGRIPGLDLAHTLNGYVYHTKFDTFQNLEPGTCQTTGENVLALAWGLANSPELENPAIFAEGRTVFYDYLGWFLISYTDSTGVSINVGASLFAFLAIFTSVSLMSRDTSSGVLGRFIVIFVIQVVTVLLAVVATLAIANTIDGMGATECWYSQTWLIFGLYFCPMFFVMSFLPSLYIGWTKERATMSLDDTIACFMHSHCLILVFICLVLTYLGYRSAYFPMVGILCYTISVIFNIGSRLCGNERLYLQIHLLCQLLPYCLYTYITYFFLTLFVPLQGRSGSASMPEIMISGICIIASMHFAGFILPVLHKFHKSMSFISIFGVLCLAFIMLASLPIGFPYREDVATQRVYVVHSNRVVYNELGFPVTNLSGYTVQPLDKRIDTLNGTVLRNITTNASAAAQFVPGGSPFIPIPTEMNLTSKVFTTSTRIRYDFSLKSADRSIIYVQPNPNTQLVDWSFHKAPLSVNNSATYVVNHIRAMVSEPLQFWIEIDSGSINYEGATFRLSVDSNFLHYEESFTDEFRKFLESFPAWSCPIGWFASFESRAF